jgi:pentatricopeptide repeat protein
MIAAMSSALFSQIAAIFPDVWTELTLGIIAFTVYLCITRKTKRTSNKNAVCSAVPAHEDQRRANLQPVIKALREGKLIEAIALVQRYRHVPNDVALEMLMSAARMARLSDVKSDLKTLAGKITAQPLEAAVTETLRNKEMLACRQLHMISGLLSIPKSQGTFEGLAKAYFKDAPALRVLVEEAPMPLGRQFAKLALEACASMKESNLESQIFGKVATADIPALRSELDMTSSPGQNSDDGSLTPNRGGTTAADALIRTTTICGPKEVNLRANDIRSCGKNGDLKGALKVFQRAGDQENSALILNSMLDACAECKDVDKALEYFNRAKANGAADVITYNTMMKCYLANGQEAGAKQVLDELLLSNVSATRTSFHGLLNARVNAREFAGAWKLVATMQASGISPNAVTCSILLKGKISSPSDVSRVLALVDAMDQPMDEVLFLSVVESCIRTRRLDLLSKNAEKFMREGGAGKLTAPTYGSMIKAYGQARDLKRTWDLWNQMMTHRVQVTAVTLGCMIEALVSNGRTSDAWQLVQKILEDGITRPLVNTIIYSSILKGFANSKETDKVLAVYEEMRSNKIQPNTITFNTILNAFAHGGSMHRVPALLEDMKAASPTVEPDIVTYSTIVKGFCNEGNLHRALRVLDDMKASGKHAPDEVMYNSLLSGCAKEHRPDEALQLLEDMRKYNVPPSNYTLSMLVKLMGRCRRINEAFTMLEDISQEYGLKINIQVYTCLIQGCFNAGQAGKAVALHEKITKEGLASDAMTYSVLVRGCLQAGLVDKAVDLARSATGNGQESKKGASPGLTSDCYNELVAVLQNGKEHQDLLTDLKDYDFARGKGGSRPEKQNCRKGNSNYSGFAP